RAFWQADGRSVGQRGRAAAGTPAAEDVGVVDERTAEAGEAGAVLVELRARASRVDVRHDVMHSRAVAGAKVDRRDSEIVVGLHGDREAAVLVAVCGGRV